MKLSEEDTSKVYMRDLPKMDEYSQIIYRAQDAIKYTVEDFEKSQKALSSAWTDLSDLMARCIARGMRLEREKLGVPTRLQSRRR